MTTPPRLTDRAALARNRTRAARDPVLFVHEAALGEVHDRLSFVNKSFTKPGIVTGMPGPWQAAFPEAAIIPDEDTLDVEAGAHDLIIHALCLHWANDPVGQLIQSRRALAPDGLFLGLLLGGETLHELRAALSQAEIDVTGGLSPRIAPMGELRELGALMQRAGFALPVADSVPLTASYRSARHLMHDLRGMGEACALAARPRHPMRRAIVERTETHYLAHFPDTGGRIRATFDLVVLTGWAPDPSQPKPLRPGSATTRLSDALGTRETPLKD